MSRNLPLPLLPKMSPVKPLGKQGSFHLYYHTDRRLVVMHALDHTAINLVDLFDNDTCYLTEWWPLYDRAGALMGFNPEKAAATLMSISSQKGILDLTKYNFLVMLDSNTGQISDVFPREQFECSHFPN